MRAKQILDAFSETLMQDDRILNSRERELLMQLAEVERRHKAHVEALFTNAAFPEVWE